MTITLQGHAADTSIVIGPARILRAAPRHHRHRTIAREQIEHEVRRFQAAVDAALTQLRGLRMAIPERGTPDIRAFIDTHLLMLSDGLLVDGPTEFIRSQSISAELALQQQRDALVQVFESMDDPYLRARKDDIDHVINHIQDMLDGYEQTPEPPPFSHCRGHVVVAPDLTPAEIVLLQQNGVLAFITEQGCAMSHSAILAKGLGLPALLGVPRATEYLCDDETLIIDGASGTVLAQPDERALAYYRELGAEQSRQLQHLQSLIHQPAITRDGVQVRLSANIEIPADIHTTLQVNADGVGLYRTEFLFLNRSAPPNEEEHYQSYREVIAGLKGMPLTIRTLDLGADKEWLPASDCLPSPAPNPALGLRAIRLCLKQQQVFRPQIRAILRASAEGPVRMLIPMLSSVQEIHSVRQIVAQCRQQLDEEGLPYDPDLPLGGMIEVPAAAAASDELAPHLDFLSIGTNDLIQYALAVDRINSEVEHLYDALHPGVIRLIQMTISAAHRHRKPISICGEMCSEPRFVRLLLLLGLDHFSMPPQHILKVKKIVRDTNTRELRTLMTQHQDSDWQRRVDLINRA